MSAQYLTDEDVIAGATSGDLDAAAVYEFCRSRGTSFPELSNRWSMTIAQRFDASMLSFEDADTAMNAIWRTMLDYMTRREPDADIWEPAYSIFSAFDAGEYDRGDGSDPVEQITKPAIKEILRDQVKGHP